MSGHSKWAKIKRKKGANDAKKGAQFSKLIKEITVAARMGRGDPEGNHRLRRAIDTARAGSMPLDNIERAVKKGTGELEGVHYEEITYEGYGPGGVALMIESVTDNKTRTVSDLRNLLSKKGGHLGETGSVGWIFKKQGYLSYSKTGLTEDKIMEVALEAGAADIVDGEEEWEVYCEPQNFDEVRKKIEKAGLKAQDAEISMIPQNTIKLGLADAQKTIDLMDSLDENDDIQKVYSNFDIPPEIMEKIV